MVLARPQPPKVGMVEDPLVLGGGTAVPKGISVVAGENDSCYWRDVWSRRHLFALLVWRDVSVRYKQAVVGVAWAVLRPLIAMVIFAWIFGRVIRVPSGGLPYALLVLTGLLPWQLAAATVSECSSSLLSNSALITKVYFPRVLLAASPVGVALVDFLFGGGLLLALSVFWYANAMSWTLLALPVWTLLAALAGLGPGLLFAALAVRFRDFRFIVPFLLQLGLYASPVVFLSDMVPEQYRFCYALNPMVGIINGFRWSILGGDACPMWWPGIWIAVAVIGVSLSIGVRIFRKMEIAFADVI